MNRSDGTFVEVAPTLGAKALVDSAMLKIERAQQHIYELIEIIREQRPYSYIATCDTKTGERTLRAKRSEQGVNAASIVIGDAVFNMRSALDHTYWSLVSPQLRSADRPENVQFPFHEKKKYFKRTLSKRYANRMPLKFVRELFRLKPYGDQGGNELLWMINKFCNLDKHKQLVPTGNYQRVSFDMIKKQVPDLPPLGGSARFGNCEVDVSWKVVPPIRAVRRAQKLPPMIEQELNVPVDIVFDFELNGKLVPVAPTLSSMLEVARESITALRKSA